MLGEIKCWVIPLKLVFIVLWNVSTTFQLYLAEHFIFISTLFYGELNTDDETYSLINTYYCTIISTLITYYFLNFTKNRISLCWKPTCNMYIIYCLIKVILFLTVLYLFISHYNEIQGINLAIFYMIRSILLYIFIIIIKCKNIYLSFIGIL